MNDVLVGDIQKRRIRDQVDRILSDLGRPEPPLRLEDVRLLLKLDLRYYSSSDVSLIGELTHKFQILTRKTLPDAGKHLLSALAKSRLCAFWVPQDSRIFVDASLPDRKHRWIEAHEISHSVTPWHKHYLLGDNTQTLDPGCHATLEAEANYGAGRLLFLQDQFFDDARDLNLSFDSIRHLAKRYDNSILSTFWRTVEDRDPAQPVFGLISIHPKHPSIGDHDGPDPWRYFIRSAAFRIQFSNLAPADIYPVLEGQISYRNTGPVLQCTHVFADAHGCIWEFVIESFSNGYQVLTLGWARRMHTPTVAPAQ